MVVLVAFARYNGNEETNGTDADAHLARTPAGSGDAGGEGAVEQAFGALAIYTIR
jgi:hypothetical protein